MPIRPCPKPFTFTNPETREKEGGKVHEEELVEYSESEHRDYYVVAQLLEWEDGTPSIRIGYYLKPHGTKEKEWQWGSQTAPVICIESIDDLIKALTSLKETCGKKQKDKP